VISLYTLFDQKHRPLISASLDHQTRDLQFYTLYFPKTGITLFEIEETKKKILELFEGPVVVNDFKRHLRAFEWNLEGSYQAYSIPENPQPRIGTIKAAKKYLIEKLKGMLDQPAEWQKLLAESSRVYQQIENRGVLLGFNLIYPQYRFALTGRSSTSGFNIQGTTDEHPVRHPDQYEYFVHFDWTSADLRAASILSDDPKMQAAFEKSDPYTMMHEDLDDPEITREDCKLSLLKSIYSLQDDNAALDYYPDFQQWMRDQINQIAEEGYTETILGRRFTLDEGNKKTVFNAAIQGTVAHAMQNSLIRIQQQFPDMIIAEVHDSIILGCPDELLGHIVSKVAKIMLNPLEGLVPSNPRFPLKVNLGKKWRQWKLCKEYR